MRRRGGHEVEALLPKNEVGEKDLEAGEPTISKPLISSPIGVKKSSRLKYKDSTLVADSDKSEDSSRQEDFRTTKQEWFSVLRQCFLLVPFRSIGGFLTISWIAMVFKSLLDGVEPILMGLLFETVANSDSDSSKTTTTTTSASHSLQTWACDCFECTKPGETILSSDLILVAVLKLYGCIMCLKALLAALDEYGQTRIRQYLMTNLSKRLVTHLLLHHDVAYFDSHSAELLTKLNPTPLVEIMSAGWQKWTVDGIRLVVLVYWLARLHWPLLLGIGVIYPTLINSARKLVHSRLVYFLRQQQSLELACSAILREALGSIYTLKSFSGEVPTLERYTRHQDQMLTCGNSLAHWRSLWTGTSSGLEGWVWMASLYFAMIAFRPSNGESVSGPAISTGELMGFYLLFTQLRSVANRVVETYHHISEQTVWAIPLLDFLNSPGSGIVSGTQRLARPVRGKLDFCDVCFTYPRSPTQKGCDDGSDDTAVLDQVSFCVQPNTVLALVGESGSGKSSIAKLALRLYDPTSGCIKLDGVDIRQLDLVEYHRNVCIVSQNPILLGGTIADNISFGAWADKSQDTKERRSAIQEAARKACAHEFIEKLPHGYDTVLGGTATAEGATKLSGGQKARIAIARALFIKPAVCILDEATANLDSNLEAGVMDGVAALKTETACSVLVIAHRLATFRSADSIVVLDGTGRVVEQGTHDSLLSQSSSSLDPNSGFYANLVQRQLL